MASGQKYIVVFKDSATKEEIDKYAKDVADNGGSVSNTYDSAVIKGFAASIPDSYLSSLKDLTGNGPIESIEPDSEVHTQTSI